MVNTSIILIVIAVLIALTNVISEVAKNLVTGEKARRLIVIAVATILVYICMLIVNGFFYRIVQWWIWFPTGVLGGFVIAYGAMFGYDNLYSNLLKWLDGGNSNGND